MKEQAILSYNKGISNSPSDFICEDGMLAECVNLEVKDQELIPVRMPVKLDFSLTNEDKLLCIHNIPNSPYKNYIYLDGSNSLNVMLKNNTSERRESLINNITNIVSIESIGNTLLVYTSNCTHYLLFKEHSYIYLGDRLPKINISFNLKGDFVVLEDDSQVTVETQRGEWDEEEQKTKTEIYKAAVNKFIEEKATAEGKFMYPFFVRYALTLANGEHVCHSAPVLLLPSSFRSPYIMEAKVSVKDDQITSNFVVGGYVASLQYKVNDADTLSDWSDVIRGVDIYVSRQTLSYDQSYNGTQFNNHHNFYEWFIGEVSSVSSFNSDIFSPKSQPQGHRDVQNIGDLYNIGSSATYFGARGYSEEDFKSKLIENSSIYYKYLSLSASEIAESSSYTLIDPTNPSVSSLSAIEQYEVLADDYMTNDALIPSFTTVYNGRLNIANIKRVLFEGFKAESMVQSLDYNSGMLSMYDVYVNVSTSNGGTKTVKSSGVAYADILSGIFFYPDTDAYMMIIHDRTRNRVVRIPLVEHPGLNGAFGLIMQSYRPLLSGIPGITESSEPYDYMENKLFTSDVNNPFYFPLAGINTVGNSKILGISAMTRPVSQGQFGEYPLVAFCSDGNYALRVDANGYYSGISPIQEDVVIGNDKITSLENSIAMVTQKGLMITSGGEITKIASQIDGVPFDSTSLERIGGLGERFQLLIESSNDTDSFVAYLKEGKIAYDYSLNRILLYNPSKAYSYLYNFDNAAVTKMVFPDASKIVNAVLDYPDTIVQTDKGELYSLYMKEDINDSDNHTGGIIVTRPLKLGALMNLKSIYRLKNIHSGLSENSYVKYNIYGSNDNANYYLVPSRFGKPYKFYRLVIYTNLLSKEALSGTIIEYEKRRTNKIR